MSLSVYTYMYEHYTWYDHVSIVYTCFTVCRFSCSYSSKPSRNLSRFCQPFGAHILWRDSPQVSMAWQIATKNIQNFLNDLSHTHTHTHTHTRTHTHTHTHTHTRTHTHVLYYDHTCTYNVIIIITLSLCSQFQQEYQTFYHKSFRVSDYLSGTARLRDLLEKCSGIKVRTCTY